jgi:hypothetical protein
MPEPDGLQSLVTGEAEAGSAGEHPVEESPVGDSLRWTGSRSEPAGSCHSAITKLSSG